MPRPFDIITFDCYGTLIDWERGIGEAFTRAAADDGIAISREAVLAAYAEVEPEVEGGVFRPYRDVLAETARRVAHGLGWRLTPDRARFLADSLPEWPPFADTNPALASLAGAGYRLGILSNVDDDLLAGTLRHFEAPFDLVVTAQQVGSYKPAFPHFEEARRRIGAATWLHAAQSHFHDVVPARALGIPVAWINRKGESAPEDARPDHEMGALSALSEWLAV